MPDHVHICLGIPRKYAVSNVVGYMKGKTGIAIARNLGGRTKNFTGEVLWALRVAIMIDKFHILIKNAEPIPLHGRRVRSRLPGAADDGNIGSAEYRCSCEQAELFKCHWVQ